MAENKMGDVVTRYKTVKQVEEAIGRGERPYLQIGQYRSIDGHNLSRLLHKEGPDGASTFLHGRNVDRRFNASHSAKRMGLIIPEEPQQSKMVIKGVESRYLEALSRILRATVTERTDTESRTVVKLRKEKVA